MITYPPPPPYWASHPEYLLLLGRRLDLRGIDGIELVRVVAYGRSGNLIYSSQWMKVSDLRHFDEFLDLPFDLKFVRFGLDYIKYHHYRPFLKRIWLNLPPLRTYRTTKMGTRRVRLSSLRSRYPKAIISARLWAYRVVVKPPIAGRAKVTRSTNIRPSPEIRYVPFNEVAEETMTTGSYIRTDTLASKKIFERSWTGTRTPNFGDLKPKQLPVNPHTVSVRYVYSNLTVVRGWDLTNLNRYSASIQLFTKRYPEPGAPMHDSRAEFKALRKLIDKSQLGLDANLAQDFAQIGQTTRLITSNVTRIVKSVSALRRGNIPGAVSALVAGRSSTSSKIAKGYPSIRKSLAHNWLELQYGWKPLLQDIEGTLKSLPVLQDPNRFVQRVAVSASQTATFAETFDPVAISGQTAGLGKTAIRRDSFCRYVLRFRLASPLRSFMAQTGFTNPINLAWEILPFSFVVDWFLPIGPYLEALSAFDGLEFLDGSKTLFTRRRRISAVDNEQVAEGNPLGFVTEHSEYQEEWVILDRTKLTSFPGSTLPSFKNGLASVTHAQNALALLHSIFH